MDEQPQLKEPSAEIDCPEETTERAIIAAITDAEIEEKSDTNHSVDKIDVPQNPPQYVAEIADAVVADLLKLEPTNEASVNNEPDSVSDANSTINAPASQENQNLTTNSTQDKLIELTDENQLPNKPDETSDYITDPETQQSRSLPKIGDRRNKVANQPLSTNKETNAEKKKEDDKLAMYKALAIKLKKELIKSREELQKLRDDSDKECNSLRGRILLLDESLESERQSSVALKMKVTQLKQQVDSSEHDLQALQNDFETYKVKASQIMQSSKSNSNILNNTFEEDRYKQLKALNQEQQKHIDNLESKLSLMLDKNSAHEDELKVAHEKLKSVQEELKSLKGLTDKCETLTRENDNLKLALKQFRSKLKEPNCDDQANTTSTKTSQISSYDYDSQSEDQQGTRGDGSPSNPEDNSTPTDSNSNTNSSSSVDGSASGYVHVPKLNPTSFEIISRSSLNLNENSSKNYPDSDNAIISSLQEQVLMLKDEIDRIKKSAERLDLADNLEYLKNILFKFLTLDTSQNEQKQRLIPVISTILKLSPEEITKLQSLTQVDKLSMASSFFKL